MLLEALAFVALTTPTGPDMFIEACSLGCTSGAGGVQVSCAILFFPQSADMSFRFSDELDPATINLASFQITEVGTGITPQGTLFIDPLDPNSLIFRPGFSVDAQGNLTYALELGTTYSVFIPGTAQADPSPYLSSICGNPNRSRLECTFIATDAIDSVRNACAGDGGDQQGCTSCPCSNDAPQGTIGGCLNSSGASARLLWSGAPSATPGQLRFAASNLPPTVAAVLTSGDSVAPVNMQSPCFGLDSGINSVNLDGLRCAVQNVRRHGVRMSDTQGVIGVNTNGWGATGIFNLGPVMSGQTRVFQIVYRDLPQAVCGTGQNTTQAVVVTFTS